jgi:hypothetical protein
MDRERRSRRAFFKTAAKGLGAAAVASGFPSIVPSSVLGATSPGNRINVGAIGMGRISRAHDLPGIWKHESARIMAVCDLDSNRVKDAIALVNGQYSKTTGKPYDGVTGYAHYRDLLANKDVDAVVISTPDHWHALIAIDAVRAGKDVYLQKPASLTIAEGSATKFTSLAASSRSEASNGRGRSSGTRRNWCATAGLVSSKRSTSACRVIRPAVQKLKHRCRRRSITTCGSVPHRSFRTRRTASIRRRATVDQAGSGASSSAPE